MVTAYLLYAFLVYDGVQGEWKKCLLHLLLQSLLPGAKNALTTLSDFPPIVPNLISNIQVSGSIP